MQHSNEFSGIPELYILGIRHHGAGTARRMLHALNQLKPDAIAIELPAESDELIKLVNPRAVKPPIAFLYYNAQHPEHSLYLPLANFSPEYQAICYAAEHRIPVHSLDLPAAASLIHSNFRSNESSDLDAQQKKMIRDPIAYLARKAGYTDSERWWENHFELWSDDIRLFDFINELMSELRIQSAGRDDSETLIREKFMRLQLRKLSEKKYKKIAVICGAWHAPVLTREYLINTVEENFPSLSYADIRTTIIPWTYKNMSLSNGYSAGIVSPVWHEALFENIHTASSTFLVKAIQQLRKQGILLSPSNAIDASLLAQQIALLRDLPAPGIDELLESAVCVFGKGNEETISWLKENILCGDVTGSVNIKKQNLPFVQSFHSQLKKLRLSKFWKEQDNPTQDLDLRKPLHLEKSRFLHFTQLIELKWAGMINSESNALGTFHEYWSFHSHPGMEISLIQLAMYGNTFREVAHKYLQKSFANQVEIFRMAQYLEHALKSGHSELLALISEKLFGIILQNQDVVQLCTMIRPLMSSMDYGSLHQIDIRIIKEVLNQLIPKLVISFPGSVRFVDYNKSKQLMEALRVLQLYFNKNAQSDSFVLWKQQLLYMVNDESAHPLIKGKIWNILLEHQWVDMETFIDAFKFQFSLKSEIPKAAHWFEGFLYNQSAFYLMHPRILKSLNEWIHSVEETDFKNNLPLLRRVFDQIPTGERQRIFSMISQQSSAGSETAFHWKFNPERSKKMEAFLKNL